MHAFTYMSSTTGSISPELWGNFFKICSKFSFVIPHGIETFRESREDYCYVTMKCHNDFNVKWDRKALSTNCCYINSKIYICKRTKIRKCIEKYFRSPGGLKKLVVEKHYYGIITFFMELWNFVWGLK